MTPNHIHCKVYLTRWIPQYRWMTWETDFYSFRTDPHSHQFRNHRRNFSIWITFFLSLILLKNSSTLPLIEQEYSGSAQCVQQKLKLLQRSIMWVCCVISLVFWQMGSRNSLWTRARPHHPPPPHLPPLPPARSLEVKQKYFLSYLPDLLKAPVTTLD